MDSIGRIHNLQVVDNPAPERLKDGTVRPDGFRLNGGSGQRYAGQTERRPRPTESDFTNPNQLAEMQADWDRAEYLRRWRLQMEQDHQDELAAKRAQKERERKDEDERTAAAKREQLLAPARAAFLRSGGTEEEWAAQADSIAADILRSQAVQAVTNPGVRPLVSRYSF